MLLKVLGLCAILLTTRRNFCERALVHTRSESVRALFLRSHYAKARTHVKRRAARVAAVGAKDEKNSEQRAQASERRTSDGDGGCGSVGAAWYRPPPLGLCRRLSALAKRARAVFRHRRRSRLSLRVFATRAAGA